MKSIVKQSLTLLEHLGVLHPGTSKNSLKKLLEHDRVKVNGAVVRIGKTMLQPGDRVEIGAKVFARRLYKELDILFEDEHLLVINKKHNLLTIATEREKEKTAYAYLYAYLKSQNPENKIFIVHRLDRDASGLLVFARTDSAKRKLQAQFREHKIERAYIAIVEGKVKTTDGVIQNYLAQNRALKVYAAQDEQHGKLAISHYHVQRRIAKYTWLEVKTQTGRKHQIRVHLAGLGHPIIGDKEYGSTKNPINRLGLHANMLGFVHPATGQRMKFEIEAPPEFRKMFAFEGNSLRKSPRR